MYTIAALLSLIPLGHMSAMACNTHMMPRSNSNNTHPSLTVGTDGPADVATRGFFVNHISLIVNDIEASRNFYGSVLGMRHIFTYDASKDSSLMYMGHAQGGRNGTGWQSGEELLEEKDNLGGLIEFVSLKNQTTRRTFKPTASNTLSHIGLIVPDIAAAQARFESFNVPIIKRSGELPSPTPDDEIAKAWGIPDPTSQAARDALKAIAGIGFGNFVIVADPDGNLLEVQQQV